MKEQINYKIKLKFIFFFFFIYYRILIKNIKKIIKILKLVINLVLTDFNFYKKLKKKYFLKIIFKIYKKI